MNDELLEERKQGMSTKEFLRDFQKKYPNPSYEELIILEDVIYDVPIEEIFDFLKEYEDTFDYNGKFIQKILSIIPPERRFDYIPIEKRPIVFAKIYPISAFLLSPDQIQEISRIEIIKGFLQTGDEHVLRICTDEDKLSFLRENEETLDYSNRNVRYLLSTIPPERRFDYIPPAKREEIFLKIFHLNSNLLEIDELKKFSPIELLQAYMRDRNLKILTICTEEEKISFLKENEESIDYEESWVRYLLKSISKERRFDYIPIEKRPIIFAKIYQLDSSLLSPDQIQEISHEELLRMYVQKGILRALDVCTEEEKISFFRKNLEFIDYKNWRVKELLKSISRERRFEYIPIEKRSEIFLEIYRTDKSLLSEREIQEISHEELLKMYLRNGDSQILTICTEEEKISFLRKYVELIDYQGHSIRYLLKSISRERRFEYIPVEKRSKIFLEIYRTDRSLLSEREIQEISHEELLKMYLRNGDSRILTICTEEEKLSFLKENEELIIYEGEKTIFVERLLSSISKERRFEYIPIEKRPIVFAKIYQISGSLLSQDQIQEIPHEEFFKMYFQKGIFRALGVYTEEEKLSYLKEHAQSLNYSDIFVIEFINAFSTETKLKIFSENIIMSKPAIKDSVERLKILREVFGDQTVDKVISSMLHSDMSEGLKKLLSMPDSDFALLMDLFKSSKLTDYSINNVYNVFVQKIFAQNQRQILEVFPLLKSMIDAKNEEGMRNLIYSIFKQFAEFSDFSVDGLLAQVKSKDDETTIQQMLDKIKKIIKIPDEIRTPDEILNIIIECCLDLINNQSTLENKDAKETEMSIIHTFCMYYIKKCREHYMAIQDKNLLLSFPLRKRKLTRDELIKIVFASASLDELYALYQKLDITNLDEKLKVFLHDEQLLRDCIAFKKDPSSPCREDIQKHFKTFSALTKELYNQILLQLYGDLLKEVPFIPDTLGHGAFQILEGLDFDKLFANGEVLGMDGKPYIGLFHQPEKLKELKEMLEKYGFLAWNEIFTKLLEMLNMLDYSTPVVFSSLIDHFEAILSETKEGAINESMLSVLKAAYMKTIDSRAMALFGKEDYEFIFKNPGPYSGTMSGKERVQFAETLVPKMYQREFITIPPGSYQPEPINGQTIRVVVGDTTSMMNLTYGERTGACTRFDGSDKEFFRIALLNSNGFQIRFEDPATGKLVSRITGFRNGNSVFFNQLRDSLMPEVYSNEELVAFAKAYAQMLIDQTKNSEYPIQNVFIGPGYALAGDFQGTITPIREDFKEDFQIGNFPTDIGPTYAMVLATTATEEEYEEIELGLDKVERYPVLRKSVTYDIEKIHRLQLVNQTLLGGNLDDVELIQEDAVEQVISGDDWYICIMKNGEIISKILDNIPESKRFMAKKEMIMELEKFRKIEKINMSEDLEASNESPVKK